MNICGAFGTKIFFDVFCYLRHIAGHLYKKKKHSASSIFKNNVARKNLSGEGKCRRDNRRRRERDVDDVKGYRMAWDVATGV